METLAAFLPHLISLGMSAVSFAFLFLLNWLVEHFYMGKQTVEFEEIFTYSVYRAGPIFFAVAFIFFFYGLVWVRDQTDMAAKTIAWIALLGMSVVILVDLLCLPRIRFQ